MNPTSSKFPSLLVLVGAVTLAVLLGKAAELVGEVQMMAAVVFVFLVALSLSHYKYGIFLIILLLPLSATQFMPREIMGITGLNPVNVTLILTAATFLFRHLIRPHTLRLPRPSGALWLYVGLLAVGALHGATHVSEIPAYFKALQIVSFDSIGGYLGEVFLKPLLILVAAFLLATAIRNSRQPRFYLVPLFGAAIILPLSVIADVLVSGSSLSAMVVGGASFSGMHANELGLMFNMVFALCLFCLSSKPERLTRWLLAIIAVILVSGILLTFSRGAYLGLLVVITYFLYRQKSFRMMFLTLLVLPMAFLLTPPEVWERAATGMGSGDVDTISAGRVDEIWHPLLADVQAHLVVGQGLSAVLWSSPAQHDDFFMAGRIGHPHSAYLGLLLDFGIAGGLLILGFFWHVWQSFSTLARAHPDPLWRAYFTGANACLLVLLVQGFTDDRFTPTVEQSYLWFSYGMAVGMLTRAGRRTVDPAVKSMAVGYPAQH